MMKKIFSILLVSLVFTIFTYEGVYASSMPAAPQLSAPAALLMDANSGVIIYSRNMSEIYYPASITKIMTALLAIELAEGDFDQRVHFSNTAVTSIPWNAAHIAMAEGDTLSLFEALMALMLRSANEVCNAVGEHFSVTAEEFSRQMSERAREIGAVNTNFTNPHGLHHQDHYTTAIDMALIMREAIRHPKFIEIMSTLSYQILPTERHAEIRSLNNTHAMIQPGHQFYREYVVGGKTGFTNEAGNTLVTYAKRDGMELIAVVLHNEGASRSYEDTAALFEFGFNMFGRVMIFDADDFSDQISIVESREGGSAVETSIIDVYARESVVMNLPLNLRATDISREVDIPSYLNPPVREGEQVGSIRLMHMNEQLATVPLFSATAAEPSLLTQPSGGVFPIIGESNGPIDLQTIIIASVAGVFVLLSSLILFERRRRRKRRELKIKLRRQRSVGRRTKYGYYGHGSHVGVRDYRSYRYREED